MPHESEQILLLQKQSDQDSDVFEDMGFTAGSTVERVARALTNSSAMGRYRVVTKAGNLLWLAIESRIICDWSVEAVEDRSKE